MGSSKFVAIISCIALLLALNLQLLSAADDCPTRKDGTTEWPELVGTSGCRVERHIKKENAAFNPIVVPHNVDTPAKFNCTRVLIRIKDYLGVVAYTPVVG